MKRHFFISAAFWVALLAMGFSNTALAQFSYRSGGYDGRGGRQSLWSGDPVHRDDYANFLVTTGYQQLVHSHNTYNVGTLHAEVVYSFIGSRIGITYGPDYFSFSPCGIIMFSASAFMDGWNSLDDDPMLAMFEMATLIGALQFHIPLGNHIEITAGWDALKFTKMKDQYSNFYITGSLNAGLSIYLGNHFFINGYYEFNHTHNTMINLLNWSFGGTVIDDQPSILKGHSLGARLGWQF